MLFVLGGESFAQLVPPPKVSENVTNGTGRGTRGGGSTGALSTGTPIPNSRFTQEKLEDAMWSFIETINENDLKAHLSFLASDELEGRETGQRGQKLAAKYLATQFQKLGLAPPSGENGPSYFFDYQLSRSVIKEIEFAISEKDKYKLYEDFIFFSKAPLVDDADLELVWGGYGISSLRYDNLRDLDIRGKAVMVLDGEPMRGSNSMVTGNETLSDYTKKSGTKRAELEKAGAAAMLVVLSQEKFDRYANSRWMKHMLEGESLDRVDQGDAGIPAIYINEKVANKLLKRGKTNYGEVAETLKSNQKPQNIDFKSYRFKVKSEGANELITVENVVGMIEGGSKKKEVVILTAHYDHLGVKDGVVYNGADDDGSGVAALLEMAEAFSIAAKNGYRPKRTILFMPVSGEEKGLLGSSAYVDNPIFPLNRTVANLNIDMIGRVDKEHEGKKKPYVYVIGSDMLSQDLHDINEAANSKYTRIKLDYTYNKKDDPNRYYYRSDHYNFAKNNIPVIFYFTGVHEDYHKPTDEIEKIQFDRIKKITQLVFTTAWDLANRPDRPQLTVPGEKK